MDKIINLIVASSFSFTVTTSSLPQSTANDLPLACNAAAEHLVCAPENNLLEQLAKEENLTNEERDRLSLNKIASAGVVKGIVSVSPTPASKPPQIPEPTVVRSAAPPALDSEKIFALINAYRATKNLPPFEKNEALCEVARSRAPELEHEIFVSRRLHSGLRARNLPYHVTENMIHQPTEEAAVNWWLRSALHRRAIESNNRYSCGACSGKNCAQLFSSFTPR